MRISWISQYTEVKSENTLKKSEDLQGFHWYILEYSENVKWQSKCIYISDTYYKSKLISEIKHQTNTNQLLSSIKRGNTQSELHLVHNIEDLNNKYHGFNWNPQISQYQRWNPRKYYGNPINPQGFQSKILQILRIIWNRSKL